MRPQAERERQTLDIATALLGAAALWFLLAGGFALVGTSMDVDRASQTALGIAAYGYLPTVVVWLLVARSLTRSM